MEILKIKVLGRRLNTEKSPWRLIVLPLNIDIFVLNDEIEGSPQISAESEDMTYEFN